MPSLPTFIPRVSVRLLAFIATAAVVLSGIASVLMAPAVARAADASVEIRDSAFGPGTLTVAVGDTVTWTNSDTAPHTATDESGAFDSGNLDSGQSFSFTFTAPGTYIYRCDYHSEMEGTIVVEAAAAPTQAPVSPASPAAEAPQPNTALPITDNRAALVGQVLIGLGLVALAFALLPPGRLSNPRKAETVRRLPGWHR